MGSNHAELTLEEVTRAARKLGYTLSPWIDRQQSTGDSTTLDLAETKMEVNLNRGPGSIRTGTVARAHRTLSGNRRQSVR